MKKIVIALLASFFLMAPLAYATTDVFGNPSSDTYSTTPTQDTYGNSVIQLTNPLGNGNNSVCKVLKALLNVVVTLGIPVVTLFVVFAGFKLVAARGRPEALRLARQNLMWVFIGIGVFLGAWTLSQIILTTIQTINPNIPGLNNC